MRNTPAEYVRLTSTLGRKVLPARLAETSRRILTAALTPIVWSYASGHFRSSLRAAAVDRRGNPLAWYTYPAVAFLSAQTYTGRTILEIGAGQSTLWWAQRASKVVALEGDNAWLDRLRRRVSDNTDLYLAPDNPADFELGLLPTPADIVVIDGLDRLAWAKTTLSLLSEDGAIVLDNSEGYWGGDARKEHPIPEYFRGQGFQRVDFYGHAAGVMLPHCTSVFFRPGCFLMTGEQPPCRWF